MNFRTVIIGAVAHVLSHEAVCKCKHYRESYGIINEARDWTILKATKTEVTGSSTKLLSVNILSISHKYFVLIFTKQV